MKKSFVAKLLGVGAAVVLSLSGCTSQGGDTSGAQAETPTEAPTPEAEDTPTPEAEPAEPEVSDEERAAEVADLIDAIYVQERTDKTDEQCAAAKAAWDALSDAQKELVEGEDADPDYFGRDTGDASKDDPLNADGIGENEIPGWDVRRAFTAQIIINHIQARDNEKIDNMDQALDRAVSNGVKNLIIQPTHLMHGAEYDEIIAAVEAYSDKFEQVVVAEPLLGEVGSDATVINADKKAVAEALVADAVSKTKYDSLDAADEAGVAFVFMGHGTAHTAKVSYSQMATQMDKLGYKNVFVGTVEGEPEETACENIIEAVKEAGYTSVVLRPLMVVAGDHANNDMAGSEEDSWLSMFAADGSFESISCQIEGLGRIEAVQQLYVEHTAAAIRESGVVAKSNVLEDGKYQVKFTTDSSMFKVNEELKDMGELTVKDGKMSIHISLVSKSIVNLFPGTADDAQKAGAVLLNPTVDTVKYSDGTTEDIKDGTTEEVFGFDIPVPYLDKEFDLALIGTKGKWYDHKVIVSSPV